MDGVFDLDNYRVATQILENLPFCTTKEQVSRVFADNDVEDIDDRIFFLRKCMQVEDSFDLPDENKLTPEEEYECELAIFLEGSWRLLVI